MSAEEKKQPRTPTKFASSILLRRALMLADEHGVGARQILEPVGLLKEAVFQDGVLIESDRVTDAIERAAQLTGLTDFGLRLARRIEFKTYGAMGLAIEHAQSVVEAVTEVGRFAHVLNQALSITCPRLGSGYAFSVMIKHAGQFEPKQHTEILLMTGLKICRHLIRPDWIPQRVTLAHDPVSPLSVYRAAFATDVEFNQPQSMIFGSPEEFEAPALTENSHMRLLAKGILEQLDHAITNDLPFQCEALLRGMLPQGYTTIGDLAASLGCTERTLQRRLGEHGKSFTQILTAARVAMIQDRMKQGNVTHAEMAPMLGFSEPSSAIRFLKEHCSELVSNVTTQKAKAG